MRSKKAVPTKWAATLLREAEMLGLLSETSLVEISGRVPRGLLAAAKRQAGVTDDMLLLIALAAVASQDGSGERFLARKGTVDPSLDLEF
jgi:hypothetical protein